MADPRAPTFGLPPCLRVPIAAASAAAIERHVGVIAGRLVGNDGRLNAVAVRADGRGPRPTRGVGLWTDPNARLYRERLYPRLQVWVHVDYTGYREAYRRLNPEPIPAGYFLDHVQNRKAVRLAGSLHPLLRLCPVSRAVNSSGGSQYGGEGMEKDYLAGLSRRSRAAVTHAIASTEITYADPMDLTKMLDLEPGLHVLDGVRVAQALFFKA